MTNSKKISESLCLMPESLVKKMPRIYEQDGKGDAGIVYAHLFGPVGDFWLTEVTEDGTEAFGYTKLAAHPDGAELGYLSITELQQLVDTEFIGKRNPRFLIERDMHWTERTLGEVMKENRS